MGIGKWVVELGGGAPSNAVWVMVNLRQSFSRHEYLMNAPKPPKAVVIVDDELCLRCGACVGVCPSNGMFLLDTRLIINGTICRGCAVCIGVCPVRALSLLPPERETV